MAYTKLNLKDYEDRWDAEKVNHLENGIIANENAINKVIPIYSNEDEGKVLKIIDGKPQWVSSPPVVLNSADYNINLGEMFEKGLTYMEIEGTKLLDFIDANYSNTNYPRIYMTGFGEEIQIIAGCSSAQLYGQVRGVMYGNSGPYLMIKAECVIARIYGEGAQPDKTGIWLFAETTPLSE